MPRLQIKHVISDNDGTMVPFPTWFGPAMLLALPLIAAALRIDECDLRKELAKNITAGRSHEYAYPFIGPFFQSIWKGTKEEFVAQVTKPFFEAVDSTRARYLSPYPGVVDALKEAGRLHIPVTVLSDAPLYATLAKLKQAGLEKAFAGVYAMHVAEPDPSTVWNEVDYAFCRERVSRLLALGSEFDGARIVTLDWTCEKPHPGGVLRILSDAKMPSNRVAVIGDSRAKDGGVAETFGMPFVWARYGASDYMPPQYKGLMRMLFDPDKLVPHRDPSAPPPPVTSVVATYDGIVPLLHRYRKRSVINAA
jgi:FMN phosphatase YigB (HAD superfamily)